VKWAPPILISIACALGADRQARALRAEPSPPLFAGCAAVLAGGICELPKDSTLRVWGPADLKFDVDGKPIAASPLRVLKDGTVHRVVVPPGGKRLSASSTYERYALRLAPLTTYPWLLEARAIRAKDPDAARARAEAMLGSGDPAERALALGLIARVELGKGQVEPAIKHFYEALSLPSARASDRAEDAFALAFALNQRSRRYAEARSVLDAIEPSLAIYPEGRARLPFYRAEIALETGDTRAALQGLALAESAASRLAMTRLERNARGLRAAILQIQGHFDEGIAALSALDRELSVDGIPCERAETLNNLGLALERRARAREDLGEAPTDDLSAPAARALSTGCPDPHQKAIALYVSAAAALSRGEYGDARKLLSDGRAALPGARTNDVLQWLDLEARIAVGEKRFVDAIAKHDEAIAVAEAAHQTDMLWRAVVGRAEALDRSGDNVNAIVAYRHAERLLDDQALALPLGDGRGVYLSRSERSARLAIALLLREKKTAEAFAVARRARARLLVATARATSLDALGPEARKRWDAAVATFRAARAAIDEAGESDWKLSASALRDAKNARSLKVAAMNAALDDAMASLAIPRSEAPLTEPKPGETWLGFHGNLAFIATWNSVTTAPASPLPELDLSHTSRLVVMPYGENRTFDFHTRYATVPVEYALDVPATRAPVAGYEVAIVVDPTNDLAATRKEAHDISELFATGYAVRTVAGQDATARMVEQLLEASAIFHYAGHGVFGGPEGIESRLPLAHDSALGLLDVLTRARVPRHVMLSACELGRAPDARTETIGLAHAFVIAGSETVIAPTRKVNDTAAAKLAVAYYRALVAGAEPSAALLAAQRALSPAEDPAAWRLLRH
jgi:cellulose synthase operon protein C